ncbi:HpcH/HpaI aldolase/citrate lyase family protein [Variovorax saccharolyticus]|uniref:HpcH/HpaI aldolase/citrate lyase family protein n=1 Tax=Variovorax saccharolyticus TaxID=3053516 RepID=UPI002578A270|nr:CoA ester lyase [Variovorax sp. J22R187]MDM0021825.1 CoA ester lyase [Variovorax sp. J22R187]
MRSLLFVPGHDARKLAKGLACGADALIIDLEDSVPDSEKARAREVCAEFIGANRERMPLFVRVNALSTGFTVDDLRAVVHARPYGVMLPKCASGHDVAVLDAYVGEFEANHDVAPGSLRILPIVTESAASLFGMDSYRHLAGPRLCGMFWGGEDLASDIGASKNRDPEGRYTAPYQLARALTLLGATAAQVPAIDAVFTDFRDHAGLKAEAAEAVRDGFCAKVAIHPDQIGPINDAFTPSPADVAWARHVVAAFDSQPAAGAIAIEGRMLDRPHYRSAQRLLARAALVQT